MMAKHGSLSINSENIFPIIKKWLYSDHDIFYRELVSNGCDAITKLKKLDVMGEYQIPDGEKLQMHVIVNPEEKTIRVTDNGIGMTADEVDEYINQIAFSGAAAFLDKYKDKTNEDQIIGHFGLGFYSAFMVADRVTIDTLSWQEGAAPVHWECDGATEFDMGEGDRTVRGTEITLYLNEDSYEFANEYRAREVLDKYCSFMPTEIFLEKANAEPEYETIPESEVTEEDTVVEIIEPEKKEEKDEKKSKKMHAKASSEASEDSDETPEAEVVEDTDSDEEDVEDEDYDFDEEEEDAEKKDERKAKIVKRPKPINDTTPLWTKHPNDCTDEEYREFYRKVFNDYKEPLFWIHLNMDYPFNLKGILYFPKINMEYESAEGVIKLYNNQVFIADNIKEVIPEFLMLLKGVIDCPDLPLNVSRSALQNDGFVKKISDYITKKVADKLTGMCKTDRENYEKYWDDISPFIKYGCLKDEKFCEKMSDYNLFKDINGKYLTLKDYLAANDAAKNAENAAEGENGAAESGEAAEVAGESGAADQAAAGSEEGAEQTAEVVDENGESAEKKEEEPKEQKVFYVTDEVLQSQYIRMFKEAGMDAVILNHSIDQPFISQLEQKNEGVKFLRIDADVSETLKEEDETQAASLEEMKTTLTDIFRKAVGKEKLEVKVENLKDENTSSMLTVSEESRRMQDMMKMYGMYGMGDMGYPVEETLILNAKHPLVKYVLEHKDGEYAETVCRQLYDLARIANQPLGAEDMAQFIRRSNEIMMILAK
ncbi:MAG: molecular chaperone HtpG [Lachnospiraceae bacterium]|nr:molecular chaperone HtpG [Lachnospiraceae bacterium]